MHAKVLTMQQRTFVRKTDAKTAQLNCVTVRTTPRSLAEDAVDAPMKVRLHADVTPHATSQSAFAPSSNLLRTTTLNRPRQLLWSVLCYP